MTNILSVDQITSAGGTIDLTKSRVNMTGHIIQIVQGELTTTSTGTAASGTNVFDDTGLSARITPLSPNNKILVSYVLHGGSNNAYNGKSRIVRNSTPIGLGTSESSRGVSTSTTNTYTTDGTGTYHCQCQINQYLDTPNTTLEITYKIQIAAYGGTVAYGINRSSLYQDGGAAGYDATPISTITLMEISG